MGGTCLDINALAYANSGLSIAQDIIIIALPVRVVWKMNMDTKKKWSVAFMFALGGLYESRSVPLVLSRLASHFELWLTCSSGCIISIIRLRSLLVFGTSIDPSWDYVPVVIWTVLELAAAIICSSLPALRTLVIHIYPKIASSFCSTDSTGNTSVNSRTRLRASSRMGSNTGAYLLGDVHIECGRLEIKWQGDMQHVEEFG